MKRVLKYGVPSSMELTLTLPAGWKVVHFADYNVWAEVPVDDERPMVTAHLRIAGTGWDIPDEYRHEGTWVTGPFVWHLYANWSQDI